ncbi:MAG: acetyltransferase [Deltaproteobacteria bacterium CG_4_10_14_0_2_um_filter_43_8]|nr:MAG: acetyltransferase [Deltaproteobacteria bacterium CG11_big_fil_rev_8_21_14_0_20_42_23]PJA18672.1 MAG: acetyltransferase [Deltaproteobacteria bacterium CG_4_10_14_0_2_um_filter_43_8]PJC64543.1 MAG: acetyltransferase [Deltaproteobacteria bacterium CG_4_9_14_0_2_um_filter_42_21]
MSKVSILLLGAGGHAKSCIDVIEQTNLFSIAGLLGSEQEVGSRVLGYPVLCTDKNVKDLLGKYQHALVTVGQIKSPELRVHLFQLLEQNNFKMPIVISPHAYVSPHATLGAGTIVMHGAVVNAGAIIGDNCIINNQALVEHDVKIGNHCHISTGSKINGDVHVGDGTFIGSGACVRQSLKIGAYCVIGMGQSVLVNCEPNTSLPAFRKTL